MKPNHPLLLPLAVFGFWIQVPDARATLMPLDTAAWTILDQEVTTPLPYVFSGGPWTWDSTDAVTLTVTDLYTVGDRFNVYDNGKFLGVTSEPGSNAGLIFVDNPDEALLERAYSRLVWNLGPGAHSITIEAIQRPDRYASVAFRANRIVSVPEGGTSVIMLGMALAGVAGFRWRDGQISWLRKTTIPALADSAGYWARSHCGGWRRLMSR